MSSSKGPTFTSAGPCAIPAASCTRTEPRLRLSDQVTPFPHSGCAGVTEPATRTLPTIGLRQPTAARSVGDGCTATPCAVIFPGIRTSLLDELATSDGVSLLPQPVTNSKPATLVSLLVYSPCSCATLPAPIPK